MAKRAARKAPATQKVATNVVARRPSADRVCTGTVAAKAVASPVAADDFAFSPDVSLEDVRHAMHKFATERDWAQFHSPRNLLMALVGEVGEVAEVFRWTPDAQCGFGLPSWSEANREALEDELADVQLYLARLAAVCHVDLPRAVQRKMIKNAAKYPADAVRGSALKYSEFKVAGPAAAAKRH